jgi:pathogenesis-related protein 1
MSVPPHSARQSLLCLALWFSSLASQLSPAAEPPQVRAISAAILEGQQRDRFLAAHNAARKAVAVDPLTWSDALAAHALESLQQQQETLIRVAQDGWATGHIPLPAHRTELKYGENIAAWTGSRNQTAERAVALWLREKPVFDLLNALDSYRVGDERPPPASPGAQQPRPLIVGHYTQIIWRSTRHLGAAQLKFELVDDRGTTRNYVAIICNYDPPGNRSGEKPY